MKKIGYKFVFSAAALLLLGSLAAGCAAVDDFVADEAPVAEEPAYAEEMMEPEMAVQEEVRAGSADYVDAPQMDRMIIKSSYIELEVETGKFEEKLFTVSNLAEQNNGFVSHTESYSDAEGNISSGRIIIRVPAQMFDFILDEVRDLGTVRHISISGQDVTEEYVDLESRLKNLEAQEEVLLNLMEEARTVSDSIEVQRELSMVQGDIEVLRGRLNYLDDLVAFSTIEVYVSEPPTIRETPGWGFVDALRSGARGAVRVFDGMITALIVISPVLVLIAIILVIVWAIIKGRRRRREQKKE